MTACLLGSGTTVDVFVAAESTLVQQGSTGFLVERVYSVLRGRYVLTLAGNQSLGERVRVEVRGGTPSQKLWASGMPLQATYRPWSFGVAM